MRAIIIGAGRGSRLKAMTDHQPKCYATVGGRRILDWTLEAFAGAGLGEPVFIGGYQYDLIRRDYPRMTFCHNADWANNNILLSLFHAEAHMGDGFVCSYADILFRDTVVREALEHPGDIVLCVDTRWRDRYGERSQHPEHDAEKVIVTPGTDRVERVHREIESEQASFLLRCLGVAAFAALWDETPRYRLLARIVRLPGVYQIAAALYELLAIVLYAWNMRREKRRGLACPIPERRQP